MVQGRRAHGRGVGWEFKAGGGAVVGRTDLGGALSGSDLVYVYPDMWTVVAGMVARWLQPDF